MKSCDKIKHLHGNNIKMAANINKYIGISDEQMQSILSSRAVEPPPHLQHSNSEDVDFFESDNLYMRQSLQMLSNFRSQAQQSQPPLTFDF